MRPRPITSACCALAVLAAAVPTATAVTRPLKNIKLPKVNPHRLVTGKAAHAVNGTWRGSGRSYSYQWQECDDTGGACSDIPGATQRRLLIPEDAAGGTLRISVTAVSHGQSLTAVSPPSSVVLSSTPSNTVAPSISGRAAVGGRLSVTKGTWMKVGGVAYTYQWQRCDQAGAGCVDLPGEVDHRFDVAGEDVGHTLRAVVTATSRSSQTSSSATSAPSLVVTP